MSEDRKLLELAQAMTLRMGGSVQGNLDKLRHVLAAYRHDAPQAGRDTKGQQP